jgi:hypothetical protein
VEVQNISTPKHASLKEGKNKLLKPMTTTMNEDVALGQLPMNFPFVLFTFHLSFFGFLLGTLFFFFNWVFYP